MKKFIRNGAENISGNCKMNITTDNCIEAKSSRGATKTEQKH